MKKSISDFEDQISDAKNDFFGHLKTMLTIVENQESTSDDVRRELIDLHSKGGYYFDLFARSVLEYGLEDYKLDKNILNSKINDALDIANTIITYWSLLKSLKEKFSIQIPQPAERAYSTVQLFIKEFEPEIAKALEEKFLEAKLPIYGFTTKKIFIEMTQKQQVRFGIIAGFSLLVTLLIIGLIIECPTQFQDNLFKTILALAAASFAATIPGLINVKYREFITASGALAVFVIVFLFQPAEISDFKTCQENIKGTVYFGNNPKESVDLLFIKQNQSTKTDNFGNFNLPFDFSSIDDVIKIQLKNNDLALDTILSFQKSEIKKSIDIYIKEYCVKCVQSDSSGTVVGIKTKCSASYEYLSDYIDGFSIASAEQGLTAKCERN